MGWAVVASRLGFGRGVVGLEFYLHLVFFTDQIALRQILQFSRVPQDSRGLKDCKPSSSVV